MTEQLCSYIQRTHAIAERLHANYINYNLNLELIGVRLSQTNSPVVPASSVLYEVTADRHIQHGDLVTLQRL